mgnify:CR=1 FL=1
MRAEVVKSYLVTIMKPLLTLVLPSIALVALLLVIGQPVIQDVQSLEVEILEVEHCRSNGADRSIFTVEYPEGSRYTLPSVVATDVRTYHTGDSSPIEITSYTNGSTRVLVDTAAIREKSKVRTGRIVNSTSCA